MAGPPFPPLDPLPPIGANPAEMAAHRDARLANQVFGEGYAQSQLAAAGADPGSMFAHQVAANAAMAAQGAIQQQVLRPPARPSQDGTTNYSSPPPKGEQRLSSHVRPTPTTSSINAVALPSRPSRVVSTRSARQRKSTIGAGEWTLALIVIVVWFYIATLGFKFLEDPLAYIPPVLFAYIVIEDWAGG